MLGRVGDGADVVPESVEVSVVGVEVDGTVSATRVGTDELDGH